MSFMREMILRLRAGEEAPPGTELLRLIGSYQKPVGSSTGSETIYVVVARREREMAGQENP
jgi:hypothetical protein